MTVQHPARRVIVATTAAGVLVVPAMAAFVAFVGSTPRAVAQNECSSSDVQDDYTLSCVPTMVPDTSDQLSEAEVAQPGFNGPPSSGGGAGGGGHR
jgi:hypothetical protein